MTGGTKNNKERRHKAPVYLALEHSHKVDLSVRSPKAPAGQLTAWVSARQAGGTASDCWTPEISLVSGPE